MAGPAAVDTGRLPRVQQRLARHSPSSFICHRRCEQLLGRRQHRPSRKPRAADPSLNGCAGATAHLRDGRVQSRT